MDPLLQVRDAAGKILGEVDDTNKKPDCQLAFVPPADGVYDLLVRDLHHHGGERYVYQVHARVRAADFQLKLAGGTYVLKPKAMLEIPLDVIRPPRVCGRDFCYGGGFCQQGFLQKQ